MNVLMFGVGKTPSSFIRRQMEALLKLGVEVTICPEIGFWSQRLCMAGLAFHLPEQVRESLRRADLFHFQWPRNFFVFRRIARKMDKKTVLSMRGRLINTVPFLPGYEKYKNRLKAVLPECNAYHCVSQQLADSAVKLGAVPSRIHVIRPAVDTSCFSPSPAHPNAPPVKIAMVGALIPRKGNIYAVEAAKILAKEGKSFRLTIVGDGEERLQILNLIKREKLENYVILKGALREKEVLQVLKESHIFLLTSLSEGIANSAIEAMACGLPVVTTDAGGMREVIDDGQEGFIVPPKDTLQIAARLRLLIEQPDTRERMGRKGRDRCVEHHDLAKQAEAFVALYETLLGVSSLFDRP